MRKIAHVDREEVTPNGFQAAASAQRRAFHYPGLTIGTFGLLEDAILQKAKGACDTGNKAALEDHLAIYHRDWTPFLH